MAEPFTADQAALAKAEAETAGPSVLFNSAANLAGLAAGNFFGFLAGLITARALGPAGVGVLAVSFGISEFGRSLSNFTHNPSIVVYHRGEPAAKVFGTSLLLKLIGTSFFVALIAAFSVPLGSFFSVPWWAVVLTSLVLVVGVFQEIGAARFEAENRMVFRNVLIALGPTFTLLAVGVLVLTRHFNVATSILTSVLGTLAMSVGFALYWRSPWRLRFDRGVASYLVSHGSRIALATFLNSSLIWTDTLLISHFLDNSQAGVYQAAFSLTFVMVTASVAIGVALVPVMSRLAGKGESTAHAYQRGTFLALLLALAIATGYLLLGRVILSFYGPGFGAGYVPLLILTLFGIFGALAVPATSVLMVHDKAGRLILVGAAQVAINLPLNLLLIQRYGITGAAIATTTAFTLGTIALWIIVRRETGAWPLAAGTWAEGAGMLKRAAGKVLGRRRA